VPDTAYGAPRGPAPAGPVPPPDPYDEGPPWGDDYSPFRRPLTGGWDGTRQALVVEFVAAIIALVVTLGATSLQCGGLFMRRDGGLNIGMFELMRVLLVILLIAALAAIVLMLVARCMACTSPAGHRGLAIGAASCFGAGLLLGGLFILVGIATGFRRESEVLGVLLLILAGLVLLAAHILWCIFLRGVAAFFGDNSLAVQWIVYLVLSIVLPLVVVLLIIVLESNRPMRFGARDALGTDVVLVTVQSVVSLGMLGWYLALLMRSREVIARGARPSRERSVRGSAHAADGGYWEE
jgi:hypothetical protein